MSKQNRNPNPSTANQQQNGQQNGQQNSQNCPNTQNKKNEQQY